MMKARRNGRGSCLSEKSIERTATALLQFYRGNSNERERENPRRSNRRRHLNYTAIDQFYLIGSTLITNARKQSDASTSAATVPSIRGNSTTVDTVACAYELEVENHRVLKVSG